MVPAMVSWVQMEARTGVKNKKSTIAFNLAEAGVERGMWKLKSSTSTWAQASAGTPISGYHFDTTYTDVAGGTYRISFSSGVTDGNSTVLVWAEGRDDQKKETRSIQAVFENETIPGAIISGGTLKQAGTAIVHWGPVMAQNTITVSGNSLTSHYPRKLSKQAVVSSPAGQYDTTWPFPPNTDNVEWWAAYDVPELPDFDFAALRSSAAATMYLGVAHNTVNCNGTIGEYANQEKVNGIMTCSSASPSWCTNCVAKNLYSDNRYNDNDVWYWDTNAIINQPGVNGTVIVRGNLLVNGEDFYGHDGPNHNPLNMHVPVNAWMEYQHSTLAGNHEPALTAGATSNNSTYILGNCGDTCEGSASGCDVAFMGFVYVGGDVNMQGAGDVYGAVWVVGNWYASGNNLVFYNNNLNGLPTLNVVLVRTSWQEVGPNAAPWH